MEQADVTGAEFIDILQLDSVKIFSLVGFVGKDITNAVVLDIK